MEEVENMLQNMQLQQVDKWNYDPHHVISKRRVEISYARYTHESRPEIEKLANGGKHEAKTRMEIETPHPIEKGLKRGVEEIIDLDDETSHSLKKTKLHGEVKESEPLVGSSSTAARF